MSEIFTLAQNFKKKSSDQAKTIEKEVEDATKKLNDYMTVKLSESEAIIKDGMKSLDTSNEDLKTLLTTQKGNIDTALKTYLEQLQAPLTQDLEDLIEQTQTMIENYATHIEELIRQREKRLTDIIKSDVRTWTITAGLIGLTLFVAGAILGATIVQKFSKPIQIIQQPQIQQPINYGRR